MTAASSPSISLLIGRALLGLYFFVPGIMKFLAWDTHIAMMEAQNVPAPAIGLFVAGAASVCGALLLWSGRYVRLAAFGFVAYTLLVNAFMHDFWVLEGDAAAREMQNSIKNLGIVAGLLVLAGAALPRWPGQNGWLTSDRRAIAG